MLLKGEEDYNRPVAVDIYPFIISYESFFVNMLQYITDVQNHKTTH